MHQTVHLFWRIMALARAIGSSELDADVVLALLGVKVVMGRKEPTELIVLEGRMGVVLVLEEGEG